METKQTILVVDDTPENIDVLAGILREQYRVKVALNGEQALKLAKGPDQPDLILLDVMMPELDGYEVCERLQKDLVTRHIPVIFVTARSDVADEIRGFELGAVDYITKPISPPIVKARVRTHLALYDQQRELERRVSERTRELERTRLEIVRCLGAAAEYKDNETGMHVIRMSHYTHQLALAAGLHEEVANLLLHAAPMHDVGKIGIPDAILQKPGKLDPDEWEIMKRHALYGAEILSTNNPSPLLLMAKEVAITHHEKWDGSGYPYGLRGEMIPISGRLVAIADVFDALTSERPYKRAWSVEDAMALLRREAGKHFDPELVVLFEQCLPEVLRIRDLYADE
ncbi:HD-GYP domain-containing protein [Balneatrix alpica]|uniref:HD-GYP domain-containing protein n=1 Tax=Balneatrix alpica TaxID=75684 RepID=A0ABV5ZAT4_9GAMM|nr:two-component system response regulator [Balneatrix alpica]